MAATLHLTKQTIRNALLFFVLVPAAAGIGFALAAPVSVNTLAAPFLAVPAAVLCPVCLLLSLCEATGGYLVFRTGDLHRAESLRLLALCVGLTLLWPPLLFRCSLRLLAFLVLLLRAAVLSLTMTGFYPLSSAAFRLLRPSLWWTLYLAYFALGLYLLNP